MCKDYIKEIKDNTEGKMVERVEHQPDEIRIWFTDGSHLLLWGIGCEHCENHTEVDVQFWGKEEYAKYLLKKAEGKKRMTEWLNRDKGEK